MSMKITNRSVLAVLFFCVSMLSGLSATIAARDSNAYGVWLASASQSDTQPAVLGRLMLRDGVVIFAAPGLTWRQPVSDIKLIADLKGLNRRFRIETFSREVMYVSILGQQMLPESPSKVIQVLERAVRESPRTATAATLVARAGGGPR